MIPDHQTNTIYFSDFTQEEYPEEFFQLKKLISDEGYAVKILDETDDFYCRDFMPIQLSKNDFIQFRINPLSHFSSTEEINDPLKIILINKLTTPRNSNIILDGGNMVRWTDKVIITDRVYKDNIEAFDSHEAILTELERILQCQVIIIPEYPNETTGHADKLIRFIDSQHVFINDTSNEPNTDWLDEFLDVLNQHELEYIELPCPIKLGQETASGLYINYLQIGNLIVVPKFNLPEDNIALKTIQSHIRSGFKAVGFESEWITTPVGVLNYACWGIMA